MESCGQTIRISNSDASRPRRRGDRARLVEAASGHLADVGVLANVHFANTGRSRTDRNSISCVTGEPTIFCLGIFLFFFGSLIQIWVSEQKLGHVTFSQETFCCGM